MVIEAEKKMCEFSIIIPVYNAEKYIDDCLTSVVGQTYSNFEVLVIDDGSSDKSGEKCDGWSAKDGRINSIHQKNKGAAAARNVGIRNAKGNYIIFLDSDDYWLSRDVLTRLHKRLLKTQADVLSFNYCKDYGGKITEPYFVCEDMPMDKYIKESFLYISEKDIWVSSPWNKVIRRNLFENERLYFESGVTAEDIDWCVRLFLEAKNYDYISLPVVGYRQISSSVSSAINERKVECLLRNTIKANNFILQNMEKGYLLKPYLAYQIGTLLFNMALLSRENDYHTLESKIEKLIPIMKESKNKKIKVLRIAVEILGVHNTIKILRIFQAVSRIMNKEQ